MPALIDLTNDDDMHEAVWLDRHEGAAAMESPEPEQEVWDVLMDLGWHVRLDEATTCFADLLEAVKEMDNAGTPF